MNPKILAPLVIIALALLIFVVLIKTPPRIERVENDRAIPTVRVIDAQAQTLRHTVRTQGTVIPRTQADLVSEIAGRVIWVSPALAPGGFFEAGDPLLRIEKRDFELAQNRSRAALRRAAGERDFRQAELKRQEALSAKGVASPSQLADARRAAEVAEADWQDARAALEQATRDLDRTELRAPFQGRVREKNVDVGQFTNRGSVVGRLYATDYAEIRLPLADDQLAFLDLGPVLPGSLRDGEQADAPRVRLSATFAGRPAEWTGHIVRTEGEIDPRSRMINVVARVEDPYGAARATPKSTAEGESAATVKTVETTPNAAPGIPFVPLAVGLFVKAEIEGPSVENVVLVPRYAMRNNGELLVVDSEDTLHTRSVDVLRIDRDEVLVQGPLAPGERVCISPLQIVVEGMAVRPIQDATQS
ncbi:MAG: efflux RND transporter periplasmic adaptor subunit [Myxococcota bacterium]